MLVSTKEMLETAQLEKRAIPQFNINNLEWTKYILEECNILNYPVILGVSEGAIKYMGGYLTVVNLVKGLINDLNITIDVAIHLDHGSSFLSCKTAIDSGFTSVMIDASKYSLEDNIKETKDVVEYAQRYNVSVEAEIGHVGGSEDNVSSELLLANPLTCNDFVKTTKIDSLAPAIGSVHGLYKGEPKLDFLLLTQIKELTNIPLVLHGGTGIYPEQIKKAISLGVCKVNINTELQVGWAKEVKDFIKNNELVYDPRKIISSGELAIKEIVKKNIMLFKNN